MTQPDFLATHDADLTEAAADTTRDPAAGLTLRATVRYDGAPFAGWQIQPDRRTVQGDVAAALSRIANRPVKIYGASRTDAGVHAFGQVCSFAWPADRPWNRLRPALSKMLAPDIRVERVEEAPPGFHARFSARGKRYAYALCLEDAPDPLTARYAWTPPKTVDLARLGGEAQALVGEHDFAAFESTGSPSSSTVRTIHAVRVLRGGFVDTPGNSDLWRIEYEGDGFLYRMVRNMTGVLVDVARGHEPPGSVTARLASPGPFRGLSAPARGLALVDVFY